MVKGSAKFKAGFGVYLLMDTDRYFYRLKLFLIKSIAGYKITVMKSLQKEWEG